MKAPDSGLNGVRRYKMAIDFDFPRTKAISAARLASVPDLFHHRAALFFTPTENLPEKHIGSGALDITIPWPVPNRTTFMNNRAYQMPRFWVDAIQMVTGKIRWRPNFPASISLHVYDDMSVNDMAVGIKPLIDAFKVSTHGRRDAKLLHYFGAILDDSPNHIDFSAIVDLTDPSRSGKTRIAIDTVPGLQGSGSWKRIP